MLLTPIHGLPYAEADDPVREYPTTVDAPKSLQVDTLLGHFVKDTGWRNISSSLTNGWTAPGGGLFLRRIGPVVYARASVTSPATYNASLVPGTGFAGFITTQYSLTAIYNATTGLTPNDLMAQCGGSTNFIALVGLGTLSNRVIRFLSVWVTDDAWPTVLPGTPV